jgi:glycosyltransferase involved in cell wall biosynthesis
MRVAQFAPLDEAVPPTLYGGIERVVSYLTEELVDQGHEVILFASGDSRTKAELVPCCPEALRLSSVKGDAARDVLAQVTAIGSRLEEFDILHFHSDLLRFPGFRGMTGRALTTVHLPADWPDFLSLFQVCPGTPLVSVSDNQRLAVPAVNWIGTVHHGLPLQALRRSDAPRGDYLAFLGCIHPIKGPDRAIDIARCARSRLRIAAKVGENHRGYFEGRVRPHVDGREVEFLGEISDADKSEFLGNARALLFPIDFAEPFGLVMIEAMACGTPVIAYPSGSVPEVVEDGVTGFIVNSVAEAARAVSRVDELDRATIRNRFEKRFGVERMTRQYLDLYRSLLRSPRRRL